MSDDRAFDLRQPRRLTSAAVFNSPHSGRIYPPDLTSRSRLDALQLRRSEDAFVDQLFDCAPDYGAPLLCARLARAYVDLNRAAEELDPALIAGVRTTGVNPRLAAGLGVIPRIVAEGAPIYSERLGRAEALERLGRCYHPYHDALSRLLARTQEERGLAILYDCHSMPGEALRAAPRVRGRRPEIILGDRFGSSAAAWIVDACEVIFREAGFVVCRNTPFAGGHFTQLHGRPHENRHAVQIEIDRRLYLDEAAMRPGPEFDAFRAAMRGVVAGLAALSAGRPALAAE